MNALDKLALWGRRYEQQLNLRTGDGRFTLADLLEFFRLNTFLELTAYVDGSAVESYRPDPVRKLKLSLLDEGSVALSGADVAWYEVYRTAPSGDCARVKVIAVTSEGAVAGELRMLVADRMPELYFKEDPIFAAALARESTSAQH